MKNYQISPISSYTPCLLPYFVSKVPCGFPSPAQDYEEDRINIYDELVENEATTFFVKAVGHSMFPRIEPGDKLIVDKSIEPKHGHYVLAIIDGEFTVKIYYNKDNVIKLVPANSEYPEITFSEGQELKIWGVIRHIIKSCPL